MNIIMKLCKKENISKFWRYKVNFARKGFIRQFIILSGVHKSSNIDTNYDKMIEKFKKDIDIISGEVDAGNDNPKLLKDLYNVLFKLVNLSALSSTEARKFMKQYSQ